ncbi:hypothetical protein Nepgr_007777 [Nepenthes gracilis]|uniref:Transmembrane protein n=1 Tax=Nepenthes gracilis TaxID=150966 RepID=A0AAD3XIK7_NEPGR|nr:hypothetical protein Nepgr_007777 [Nepenthes gracilis]
MFRLSNFCVSNSVYRVNLYLSNGTHITQFRKPNLSLFPMPNLLPNSPHLHTLLVDSKSYSICKTSNPSRNYQWKIKVCESNGIVQDYEGFSKFSLDAILSVAELTCLVSAIAISVGCVVNWVFFRQQNLNLVSLGNRVSVLLLAGAVAVGAAIRRRQWRRVCGISTKSGFRTGNIIERIEKLENNLSGATTMIRMLSRQLEKLGIRFRVTRKSLKDPISEAAALAQKNSEATRALALHGDILEKELAEVQNVLLAMQDQQQKQLELILAMAKTTEELYETRRGSSRGLGAHRTEDQADQTLKPVDSQRIQVAHQKGKNNKKE